MVDNKIYTVQDEVKATRIRWTIVTFIFVLTAINYGARSTLGITGKAMAENLHFDVSNLGKIMAAFSAAYVIGQFPGGWLLDKFGSKKVYFYSVFLWSIFIFLCGFLGFFESIFGAIIPVAMILMFFVGLSECPAFPANSRIAAAWFPTKERGTAVSIFNSAQYFSTAIFAPILGVLVAHFTWKSAYFFMGGLGIVVSFILLKVIYPPKKHPLVNQAELNYIAEGGGLIDMDDKKIVVKGELSEKPKKNYILQLASSRMMLGICFAQYCINAITFFFISWFPVYLADARHLDIKTVGFAASIPALCGFVGGITGGVLSDKILKKTHSLSLARKAPIVLGMLCSMSMILCNYVDSIYVVILFMSISFFGKGVGALGWVVLSDTAPKEISGQAGGFFNMFGNISSIVTPLVIAEIYRVTGQFEWALIFVAAHALAAIISYLFIVGPIKRMELKKD